MSVNKLADTLKSEIITAIDNQFPHDNYSSLYLDGVADVVLSVLQRHSMLVVPYSSVGPFLPVIEFDMQDGGYFAYIDENVWNDEDDE